MNDDRDLPTFGLRLLDRVIRPDARDAVVGDLVERYRRDAIARGPAPARTRLSPLEQYAQALLMANEFVFID